jgi:phosphosulfolactate phosphohydrolase-like enzyme
VLSASFYLPPPASPSSASPSPSSLSSSLSSPSSPALLVAANARRKRAEEDGVSVEELRHMLREKEKEAEEALKLMEAKQYEVRELKERLWEKLNFITED